MSDKGYTSQFLPIRREEDGSFSPAVPGLMAQAWDSVQDAGRAMRGELVPEERAIEFGMNLMGGGALSAGKGVFKAAPGEMRSLIAEPQWNSAAMRGVPSAYEALLDLKKAKSLLKTKTPALEIEKQTGWIWKDGKWVREVSDRGSKLVKAFPEAGSKDSGILSDYFQNPAVEEIVPSYGKIGVAPHDYPGFGAMYTRRNPLLPKGEISVDMSRAGYHGDPFSKVYGPRNLAVHEGQHFLQDMGSRIGEPSASSGKKGAAYQAIPSELEATVVQQRLWFTPEERKKLPFLEHEARQQEILSGILKGRQPASDRWMTNSALQDLRTEIKNR